MRFRLQVGLAAAASLLSFTAVAQGQTYSASTAISDGTTAQTRSEAVVVLDTSNNIHVIGGVETTNTTTGASDAVRTHLIYNGTTWSALSGGDQFPNKIRGAANATWIHTKDRSRADSARAILDPIRNATGLWFGGGRQWNFSDSYYGTTAHRLMHEVLARGGVIAGSSAGASIQAEWMARGDPLGNQKIIAPGYERGLGFIKGVAIDQHFTQRDRRRNAHAGHDP